MLDSLHIVQRDDLKNQIGLFDYCFHITVKDIEEEFSLDLIEPLAKWCGKHFQYNFVLLQYSSLLVAGGCVDIKNSWRPDWDSFQYDDFMIKYFELRCSSNDALIFKLIFS